MTTLGERIKFHRQQAKLSQEKLAQQIGVSRQAVAKWESGRAAPSTENLFRLAEVFGTTVDLLLAAQPEAAPQPDPAAVEQMLALYRQEQQEQRAAQKEKRKKNLQAAALAAGGYLLIYLVGRLLWCDRSESSVLGWLLYARPTGKGSYLYGWLLHNGLFWWAMAFSVGLALLGKRVFSAAVLGYFALGLVLGIWLGPTRYGTGEYGWAYWGAMVLASVPVGAVLQRAAAQGTTLRSSRGRRLAAVVAASILLTVLLVWWGIPDWTMAEMM